MEEEVESLNNKTEIMEKENFDLKTENKNLKKMIAITKNNFETDENSALKLENQKLRKMVENLKTFPRSNHPQEPSIFSHQESLNPEFFKKLRTEKEVPDAHHQSHSPT